MIVVLCRSIDPNVFSRSGRNYRIDAGYLNSQNLANTIWDHSLVCFFPTSRAVSSKVGNCIGSNAVSRPPRPRLLPVVLPDTLLGLEVYATHITCQILLWHPVAFCLRLSSVRPRFLYEAMSFLSLSIPLMVDFGWDEDCERPPQSAFL